MATTEKSPLRKGPARSLGIEKSKVPGKSITVGTTASKTPPGAKALNKLGSSKISPAPGSAQTTPTVRKSSLPPSKKVAATGSSPAAAPKPSKPAESIGKAPVENGSASKSVKKPKAASGPVAAKGGDTGASKKAANGNGAAAAAAVARLTTVPEQDNARDASTNDFVMPVVEYIKPANQLELSTLELDEDFARNLNAARPGPPRVILRYNLEEKMYKPEPQLEQVTVQYSTEGCLVWRDSEEGHKVVKAKALVDELEAKPAETSTTDSGTGGESGDAAKRLRNQFNFSERGAQTTYFPPRERETSTDTPETAEAVGACSQWEIFDAYVADQKLQRQQEEAQRQKAPGKGGHTEEEALDVDTAVTPDVIHSDGLRKALKKIERMGVQNNYADVLLDFKYWEDEADEVRTDEGTLLPLWKFGTSLAGLKQVTAVSWSETYSDLFVAAFGSFDFQRQTSGLLAGFSLKNPAFPDFTFTLKSGAMSLQLHPQHPNLLAVGCYDGSVAVFDVRKGQTVAPMYCSTPKTGQHSRPVWAVEWQAEQPGVPLAFHSLSSDGRLLLWTLATAELNCQEILRLSQTAKKTKLPDEESSRPLLAAGCCIDFHPVEDFIFIVGTEEGTIHKCSTAHRSGYLLSYIGHDMAVYSVQWNKVDPTIFLSSSADWTIKLWHTDSATAVMSFNLGSPVGDVAWSPSLATIFAAVTEDGLARVFDLQQNAAEPLCEQKVVAKAGLTRLAFSKKHPVLLVGDDRGQLATLKLSPNLRRHTAAESEAARLSAEKDKLEAILAVARKSAAAVAQALGSH